MYLLHSTLNVNIPNTVIGSENLRYLRTATLLNTSFFVSVCLHTQKMWKLESFYFERDGLSIIPLLFYL